MPESQAEHDSEIQAFWRWYSTAPRRGIGGPCHAAQYDFIPYSAVQEYLGASQRVEGLLGAVRAEKVDAQYVREHYLRTLAILILIGQGSMINHFVRYSSLMDKRLPFRTRPEDFPHSYDAKFFDNFHGKQWQFCVTDLEYNMDLHLHKEEILPIIEKEEIGRGGNATVFKIVVASEYNKLVPHRLKTPERPLDLRDTFVLKTYRGPDAKEQHKAEHDAFINISLNGKPSPFIIAYYGSFIDDNTYNIILEYADRGNLDEFMCATPPPTTAKNMIELWDRLCKITHGISVIHGSPNALLGWHQDIKPINILVMSGSGTSNYDVYFKLADLSLCHFTQDKETALDTHGTRAYGSASLLFRERWLTSSIGAPETTRIFEGMEPFPVQVRQSVDVWSAGCVFSEAAVWSRFGWNRLLEYRRQRQEKIKERLQRAGENWFHCEGEVLETVHEIHESIARTPRLIDQVTVDILRIVSNHMLLSADQQRAFARDIYTKFSQIIDTTRSTLRNDRIISPSRKSENTEDVSDSDERPITPPSVPPGYISKSSESSHMHAYPDIHPSLVLRSTSLEKRRSNVPNLQTRIAFRQHHTEATTRKYQDRPNDTSFGPFEFGFNSLHNLPDPPSPTSSYQSSDINLENLYPLNTNAYQETRGQPSNRVSRNTMDHLSLTRSRSTKETGTHPHHHRNRSTRGSFNDGSGDLHRSGLPMPTLSPSADLQRFELPTATLSPSFSHNGTISSRRADKRISSESQAQQHQEPPKVLLSEALLWKERRKKGLLAPLHGRENLSSLNKRDHIFVVDNSDSMQPHRQKIMEVVSLLGYILKDSDPNGLDICFTQSTEKVNSRKSTRMSTAVAYAPFHGISDMRTRLTQIFQEHTAKFGTFTTPPKTFLSWSSRSPEAQRPLSFYILTDGLWQPKSEVETVIEDVVERMKAHKLPKLHVGIQFIRFGDNPQAIADLAHLDHGLGLKDINMDIVDTTPWDGNVWKQMLGALNEWYDDDPD